MCRLVAVAVIIFLLVSPVVLREELGVFARTCGFYS